MPEPKSLSRRDSVEQDIIKKLLTGELKPGDRFSELSLARAQRVTTGTIREALLRLSGLGIFMKPVRKQWQVTQIDVPMFNELMDLRVLLESFALSRYFQQKNRSREPFSGLLIEMKRLARNKRALRNDFFRLDRELHRAILEAGGNRYLAEHFQFISFPIQIQFLHRSFSPNLLQLGLAQHLALLEAIVEDKEENALVQLEIHLQSARQVLLSFINPDPLEILA